MKKIRPFLKWAGSKYNCLERVLNALPQATRLIEPFTGSGVVFMNTNYSSYLLAESNNDLVSLYSTLQREGKDFIQSALQYFKPELNNKESYYSLRSQFNQMPSSPEKSALFLYLNRHGYNGLCRYNSKGIYNVPFGLYAKPYFPENELNLFHQKAKEAQFVQGDFRKTFELAVPGDVIYCDPPYVSASEKGKPFDYTQNKFSLEDQIELAHLAKASAQRGIPVIISNHDTPLTREYYSAATIESFYVTRWISCKAEQRDPVKELIAVFN